MRIRNNDSPQSMHMPRFQRKGERRSNMESPCLPFTAFPYQTYFLSAHLGMGKINSLVARVKGHTV